MKLVTVPLERLHPALASANAGGAGVFCRDILLLLTTLSLNLIRMAWSHPNTPLAAKRLTGRFRLSCVFCRSEEVFVGASQHLGPE